MVGSRDETKKDSFAAGVWQLLVLFYLAERVKAENSVHQPAHKVSKISVFSFTSLTQFSQKT